MPPVIKDEMKEIRDQVLNLKESPLYEYRTTNKYFPVIGEGSHDASMVFVGEAPGRNEAKTGRPFCGAAGKVLDDLLKSAGVTRETVYITNIVKDRPPENRDPTPREIEVYSPFLDRQIDIIRPKVIVTLGRYAFGYIMKKFAPDIAAPAIGQAHGQKYAGAASYGPIDIIALYHPCVAIYDRSKYPLLEKDFAILKEYK